MKGIIYKIVDNTNNDIYYGSTTTTLNCRISQHKHFYKKWLNGLTNNCQSYEILKNDNWYYELVDEIEYNDRQELLKLESYYIKNNSCINKVIPYITEEERKAKKYIYDKQWFVDNPDKLKIYNERKYEKSKIKNKIQIQCDCGSIVTSGSYTKHKKTQKHLLYLDSINASY